MIRYFLAFVAALLPTVAMAQTTVDGFVVPPDVTAVGGYTPFTPTYASGSTENQVGDGSTARGGTMPVLATMPADIPSVATGWIPVSGDATGTSNYETIVDPATQEVKMRTIANFSHVNFDDPIRNWGQPGTSHCHTFFGNNQTNAFSTYASLRTRANSRAAASKVASTTAGGPYNGTGYWHPCVIKPNAFGDGKNYAHKPSVYIIYYADNPASPALHAQRLPRGMRYILGTNMSDPYDTVVKARIAAANAQSGTAGRYAYAGSGFQGWECRNPAANVVRAITVDEHPNTQNTGQNYYQGFTTSGGADPWGGNCISGDWLVANFNGPNCYDGTNLWSPGGYKHLIRRVTDNVSTAASEGCPNGWYQLAGITITMWFKHQGWSDYSTWYLSSDAAATAAAQAIDGGAAAMVPGQSMHTDWMNGWDDTTLMKWQNNCFGVNGGTMHTCAAGRISATEVMIGGAGGDAPDGSRVPQNSADEDYTTNVRADMVQVPASLTGPHVIQAN